MKQHLALTVASSLLLVACASTPSHPQDPMEPMNRAIYQFNDKADRYVMKPVAEGYRFITPQPVRTGVGNFFNNLDDVYNMANHGLQLEGRKSLTDFLRVAFNSTFGLFGLIDIATPMGLKREPTGLGDTMAHYGWKSSSYLVLPLLGPSTVRDGLGTAAHLTVADPQNLVFHVERDANAASAINAVSKREQLLQPFVRGANVGNHAGTGLGLAVVSQLLQHMHSALELDAVHGGGSRFSFDVLLDIATEQELEPGVGESHIADFCGAGRRLLVVDDVEHNREWLCDLLAGYGFEVLSANDGEHALQLLASETVELLVSDQWMPGLDAWGLLQALRQRGLHMPVLLYSATPPWRPAGVAPTLAFDACLLKPASTGELLKTLDRLLRVKHAVPAAGG